MKRLAATIFATSLLGLSAFLFRKNHETASTPPAMQMSGPLQLPAYSGKLKFLALGDSYTIGQSVPPTDRWPMQLARKLRASNFDISDPIIIARTGWTTGDLLTAVNQANPKAEYDLVTLMIGVNNEFQGRSEDEYREQFIDLLSRSIALARGNPEHVLVLSIPDWTATPFGSQQDVNRMSAEVARFNTICREETLKQKIAYVDVTPISEQVAAQPALIAEDGLHPSGQQYAMWTDVAAKTIGPLLSVPISRPTSQP